MRSEKRREMKTMVRTGVQSLEVGMGKDGGRGKNDGQGEVRKVKGGGRGKVDTQR